MVDIGVPIRELGEVDISELKKSILEQDEAAWFEQKHRQKTYEVHKETSSIVLLFCDEEWPNISTFKEPGWDRLSDVMMPIIEGIIKKHYPPGGTILRAMAARLHIGGVITPHVDKTPSFHVGHRIHIPIQTNSRVRFIIGGRPYKFEVGKAYEINNQLTHSVMNKGKEHRIHVIFDYMPKL
ncbi:MAG: aspartyl/asparaginyl beta-hydroxylase domain-containing protein [Emcibacteraceae bacterium]|nr:aspartyl/asparaginyl beta-hydroxylase domain-containing protein [Emcibacteraceae bacterium]